MATETIDFGATLRLARERRKLTLQAVSETTKISPSVLTALENNDIERLPGGLFIRSFVRAYATEVGLDPEETVNGLLEAFPNLRPDRLVKSREDLSVAERAATQPGLAGTAIGLVVLSAIIVAVLIFFGVRGSNEPAATDDPNNPTSPVNSSEPDDRNGATNTNDPRDSSGNNGSVASMQEDLRTAAADATASEPSDAEAALPGSALAVGRPFLSAPVSERDPAVVGPLTIAVHPTAACWVSLRIDGEQVFAGVLGSGEQGVYEAENQIVLNVGDAGLFDFSINDEPGRSLGEPGQVVTVEIDRDNYSTFVQR